MSNEIGRGLWTIVLAGGEGTRLRSLTRALHGTDLPKQFATIQGRRSLLETTLDRAHPWSAPERTLVVVAEDRMDLARSHVPDPRVDLVAQPKNFGTGPGILLPLARVVAMDPDAHVVILPSDHFVRDEEPFAASVRAADAVSRAGRSVVLVGAVADRAETQYGWIRTAPERTRGHLGVAGFREKPSLPEAERLLEEGALWNTFIMVGPALGIWALARKHLPEQSSLFEAYERAVGTERERQVLAGTYQRLAQADFCRNVLEKAEGVAVVPLLPCGWSDWGTPARVFRSLEGSPDRAELLDRLRRTAVRSKRHDPEVAELAAAP